MPHADQPNHVVGVDYVQVELSREEENGGKNDGFRGAEVQRAHSSLPRH